jgi:hypothetical protein
MSQPNGNSPERRLLVELGMLSTRIRGLRATSQPDAGAIQSLETQMTLKWQQIRLLRAGPLNAEAPPTVRRSGRD